MRNVMWTRLLCFTVGFVFACNVHGQYKKTYSEKVDTFAAGNVKRITRTWRKQFEEPPMHEYYTKTTTEVDEFFADGSKKMTERTVFLIATWGSPCNEVEYEKKEWYIDGEKKYYEKRKCDKHLTLTKVYNKKGVLINKRKHIYHWRKDSM
jgi:hypothetical protein